MTDLGLSFGDLGKQAGYTGSRIWQLVQLADESLPDESAAKVRAALLRFCQNATGAATGVLARLAEGETAKAAVS